MCSMRKNESNTRWDASSLNPARLGEDSSHLRLEVVPLLVFEVVEDGEPALEQVLPEALSLLVRHDPEPGLPHIEDGVVENLGIVETEDASVGIEVEQGQLLQDSGEVGLGSRVVVVPGVVHAAAAESGAAVPPHANESKSAVVPVVFSSRIAPPWLG